MGRYIKSYYLDEQKQFGLISDISHSGIKRALKKQIGRSRKKVAELIDDSINKDLQHNVNVAKDFIAGQESLKPNKFKDRAFKRIKKKLEADGKTQVIEGGNDYYYNPHPQDISKVFRDALGIKDSTEKLIMTSDPKNVVALGHEAEHLAHDLGKRGKIKKKISDLVVSPKEYGKFSATVNINSPFGSKRIRQKGMYIPVMKEMDAALSETGFRKGAKRFVKGKLRLVEERNATKGGIKTAKEAGLKGADLENEIAVQNLGTKTYEPVASAYWKIPIRNRIQIPSRRGDFNYPRRI